MKRTHRTERFYSVMSCEQWAYEMSLHQHSVTLVVGSLKA